VLRHVPIGQKEGTVKTGGAPRADSDRLRLARERAAVDSKIEAMLTAIEDGFYNPSMKERMAALEDGFYNPSMKERMAALEAEKLVLQSRLDQDGRRTAGALESQSQRDLRREGGETGGPMNAPDTRDEAGAATDIR
jgi:hypothetical protein